MLPQTLREAARRFGERTAYVTEDGWTLSYADLDRIAPEVAAGLAARGVRAGDVVALVLPPGPEYVAAYLGAAWLGAVTAGVNDRLGSAERAAVLDRAAPRIVLGERDDPVGAVPAPGAETVLLEPAGEPGALLAPLRRADGASPGPHRSDPDHPVAVVFTSGTTGTPKGARYCNRQLAAITAVDVGETWGVGGRSYAGTSFAHLGFMTKLAGNLRRGGTTFLMRRWRAGPALELVARERMTTIAGVPAQLALMLRHPDFDRVDLSSVTHLVTGGGPVTPGLAEEARARFGARLATRYSCTEAGIGLGTSFDDPDEDAVVSVGRPLPGVELALVDADGAPVPDGEVGEVTLRSAAVMSGYWRDPDATRAAFTASGFVRTGDLGWQDGDGRLRLVGRAKEMYVRGGENVFPVEVEAALSEHPAVAAVAVVPRPDAVMGEIGVACIVPRDRDRPPTLAELRAALDGRLAHHKQPEDLRIVDELPLTAMEKIDRVALARRVVGSTERPVP